MSKTDKERQRRYREKLRADPIRYAEYLCKKKDRRQAEYAKLKADPEKLAEFKQRSKEWQEAHPEKRLEISRRWHAINREGRNEKRRKQYKENPAPFKARGLKYREANKERINETLRLRAAANPDKQEARTRKRRVLKLNAPGHHTMAEWQALKSYYMDQCLCCGDVPDRLECDHIVPLSRGGSDDISNCQPLCQTCNGHKHTQTIDYR